MKFFSVILVATLGLFVSFVGLAHGSASTTAPQVLVVAPLGNQTITSGEIAVGLMATGIEIKKADGEHVDGVGHFHLYLGNHLMEAKADEPIGKDWIHTAEMHYIFKDVKPGHYVLTVVLADGKHIPLEDKTATATVNFTVEASTATSSKTEEMHKMMTEKHRNPILWIVGLALVALAALYIFVFSK